MPDNIRGLPLALRHKYLTLMYPGLTREQIESVKLSSQQLDIFTLFYGFECEAIPNPDIRQKLGIRSHNQVAVQLARAERKLGVDEDKRYEVLKNLKREYYKKHRPKCPFCRASKATYRGCTETETKWICGKCKRHYSTESDDSEIKRNQVSISFRITELGEASCLVVRVDGIVQQASIQLNDGDWIVRLTEV